MGSRFCAFLCWFVCVGVFVCIRGRRRWWGREEVQVGFADGEEREKKGAKWEINKIIEYTATVTVYICTVTVANV